MPSSTFNKYRLKGAYHYDWYENESWYKKLIDRAVGFCQGSTLELGCGEGLLVSKIASNGFGVTGIDKDSFAFALLQELPRVQGNFECLLADIDELAPLQGQWDYLACLNTIEHLKKPHKIKEILDNNITKGAIISTIDYQGGSLGEDHKREYTMDELMDFFKEYDPKPFRIEDIWIGVEIRK